MNSPIQDCEPPVSPRSKQGSLGWSLPLKGLGFGLFFGSLVWAGWASQLQLWAQPVEQQPQEEVLVPGRNLDPGAQIRVRNELVKICGDYRCEGYRFSVRVPISPEDTLETLLGRLDTEMLREVDRVFQTRPDLNRVIVDGYVFSGTPAFVSREVLLQTMFVPRHRWEVGRFGPEQDAIFYAELLGQVTPFLTPSPTPTPTPGPVPGEGVPPLPPPPGETPPIEATPTLDALGQRFREAISRINKKAEYARVAKMLLSKLQPLYQQPQADPSSPLMPSPKEPSAWAAPSPILSLEYGSPRLQKQDYDPFELRAGVMRQTSPLRAKLVLFTALYHKVEPTLQGLAALRRYSLDELLRALYDACASPQELEARLKEAVQQLQEPDQDGQAANAVLQMLKPLYVDVPPATLPGGGLAAEPLSANLDWLNTEDAARAGEAESLASPMTWIDAGIPEDEEEPADPLAFATWTTPPGPSSDLRQEIPESCRQLLHHSAGSLMVAIENTLSELGNALDEGLQDEDPAQYLTLKHQVLRGFLRDVEGSAAMFMGILKKLEQSEWRLVQPLRVSNAKQALPEAVTEMPAELADPYASLRQVLASSELAQQKPQLEQEVMRLVRRSVGSVKTAIEQALSELGKALDEQFQTCTLEEALVLKYQTLRAFLQEVGEISTKFAAFLDRMEEAERRLFGLV